MSNITTRLLNLTFSSKTVFTTAELAIFWKIEDKSVLRVTIARAIKKNYLQAVRRGIYKLAGRDVNIFELAGKLKKHSYISFETVLAQKGAIFQWHNEIISACDRNFVVKNNFGKFSYKKMPIDVILNNDGIINKGNYFIASVERALCDKIYKDGLSYFDDLSGINVEKVIEISKIYNNKRVERDIKKLFSL